MEYAQLFQQLRKNGENEYVSTFEATGSEIFVK